MSGPETVEIVRLLLDALAQPDARMTEDDSYLSHFLVSSAILSLIYLYFTKSSTSNIIIARLKGAQRVHISAKLKTGLSAHRHTDRQTDRQK